MNRKKATAPVGYSASPQGAQDCLFFPAMHGFRGAYLSAAPPGWPVNRHVTGYRALIASKLCNRHEQLRKESGFTLLEVLIALAIMSALVTVIYMSFSTAGRNVEQAEKRRDATDLARTLVAKLSEDLANAYYNPLMPETVFFGKRSGMADDEFRFDELSLTTLTNWRRPDTKETDLWEVGYRFEMRPEQGERVMVRREKRELGKASPPLEGGTEFVVTDRIAGLRLRYYDGSAWIDEWDSKARGLPRAVEILLALDDGSAYITNVEVRQ